MEIAARLNDLILERYGDVVLAIFVTSSTAKGMDRPFSDLEITAVVRDGTQIEERVYSHRGLLVEIDYPEESDILKEARQVTAAWPKQADEHRSRLVLFEHEGWTRKLDAAVAEQDTADFSRGMHSAAAALIEHRDKLRNSVLAGDEMTTRFFGAWLAQVAANLVLFANRRYMITTRLFFQQAFECPEQPTEFRRLAEILTGVISSTQAEIVDSAELLTEEVLEIVRAHGVSLESEELLV